MHSSSSSDDDNTVSLKVVLLGNGAVGKTSLIRHYCESGFAQNYKQTIGLDFYSKKIQVPNCSSEVVLHIWDIGGQQIGGKMLDNYIHGSDAVLFVYDVTNRDSFKDMEDWGNGVRAAVAEAAVDQDAWRPPIGVLVGNKADLPDHQVTLAMHEEFANANGLRPYVVSARSGAAVNGMFTAIAAELIGVDVKKQDLDMANRVQATVESAPAERASVKRAPVLISTTNYSSKKKKDDCVAM